MTCFFERFHIVEVMIDGKRIEGMIDLSGMEWRGIHMKVADNINEA